MDVETPEIGGICGGAGVVAVVLTYRGETFDACIYLGFTGFTERCVVTTPYPFGAVEPSGIDAEGAG